MSRLTSVMLTGTVAMFMGSSLYGQVKVIPGEHRTASATVEAIEMATRQVMVRTKTGELLTMRPSEQAAKLGDVKVGDTVNLTYYDNIVVRKKASGEPDVDTLQTATTSGKSGPGGTVGAQQTITATVEAIDLNVPSISLKGPRGWSYSTKVQDKNALQQLTVGDRLDITWTEAVLVSVTPFKK